MLHLLSRSSIASTVIADCSRVCHALCVCVCVCVLQLGLIQFSLYNAREEEGRACERERKRDVSVLAANAAAK